MPKAITIKTINDFSLQEIFDYVALFLLKQNKRSSITVFKQGLASESCRYRAGTPEEPLKCAVGCIMSDEEYLSDYECKTISWLQAKVEYFNHIDNKIVLLLHSLQQKHDNCTPDKWYCSLSDVAEHFELSTKAIDDYIHHKDTPDTARESECPAS